MDRVCKNCGKSIVAKPRGRPPEMCGECKRGRRRVRERASVTCVDCGQVFAPEGHTGRPAERCSVCRAERKRQVATARASAWRSNNRDHHREYDRQYQARRREDPAFRQVNSDRELVRKYGIDRAEFVRLAAEQGGRCAICSGPPRGPGGVLHVDHCHKSMRIRGLLCGPCNTAIGLLNDDPERAEALARYIREDC